MSKLTFWKHSLYPHFLAALGLGFAIALLFSYSSGVSYMFEEGQKWQYDDLIAQELIYVPFTAEKIDSLSKNSSNYTPIFTYNQERLAEAKKAFHEEFEQALSLAKKDNSFPDVSKFSKTYLQYGENLLNKIYEKGVLDKKYTTAKVKIIKSDLVTEYDTKAIYTTASALEFITDSLPFSSLREPEFLYNVLETKIKSNLLYDSEQNKVAQNTMIQSLQNQVDTIKIGEMIVKKNRKITAAVFHKLNAFKAQANPNKHNSGLPIRFLFYVLFTCFLLFVLTTYVAIYQAAYLQNKSLWGYLLLTIVLLNVCHFFIVQQEKLHPLLTPFLALPMIFRHRINLYVTAIAHLVCVCIASQITPLPYPFVISLIISGFYMSFILFFDKKPFGKITLTMSSLAILAFLFYTLSAQQHIVFDPLNILLFIFLQGFLIVGIIFLDKKLVKI